MRKETSAGSALMLRSKENHSSSPLHDERDQVLRERGQVLSGEKDMEIAYYEQKLRLFVTIIRISTTSDRQRLYTPSPP